MCRFFARCRGRASASPPSVTISTARNGPPIIFPTNIFTNRPIWSGPDGAVELRDIPASVVYQPEAEFAFVIGKTAKDVAENQALDYIFGYVPFFDISTRGMVRRTQFMPKGQGQSRLLRPMDHHQG